MSNIDMQDRARMPEVTKQEELLYSTDLAPVVRVTGQSLTVLRHALTHLAAMVEETRQHATTGPELPDYAKRWVRAFQALGPIHDALQDAYREVAAIGIEAATAEQSTADPQRSALTSRD